MYICNHFSSFESNMIDCCSNLTLIDHVVLLWVREILRTPSSKLNRHNGFTCCNLTFRYSTVSVMFISLTLTNVESRMSRDFFPWILRGISVDFARVLRRNSVRFAWSLEMKRGTAQL